MKRIRLLYVTEQAVLGGEQCHILTFLRLLDRRRFDLTVACAAQGPFVEALAGLGVRHVPVAMRSKFDLPAVLRLARLFRTGHYQIVHLHGARAGLLGRLAAALARPPIVLWTLHVFQTDVLQGWRRVLRPLYLAAEKLLANFSDLIITETETHRNKLIQTAGIAPERVARIYASIDVKEFGAPLDTAARRAELGVSAGAPLVGTIARLSEQKGISYFLQAAHLVHRAVPEARFLVVGDGPLRDCLEAQAARLGTQPYLQFTGYRPDAYAIMRCLDVFVLPTLWESFGLVFAEAMAAQVPVVTSDIEPLDEVLAGYEARLMVPPRDAASLAGAISTILGDLACYRRLAAAGPALAGKYDCADMVAQTVNVYERLLARKAPGSDA